MTKPKQQAPCPVCKLGIGDDAYRLVNVRALPHNHKGGISYPKPRIRRHVPLNGTRIHAWCERRFNACRYLMVSPPYAEIDLAEMGYGTTTGAALRVTA